MPHAAFGRMDRLLVTRFGDPGLFIGCDAKKTVTTTVVIDRDVDLSEGGETRARDLKTVAYLLAADVGKVFQGDQIEHRPVGGSVARFTIKEVLKDDGSVIQAVVK